jgi:hypothetical protein
MVFSAACIYAGAVRLMMELKAMYCGLVDAIMIREGIQKINNSRLFILARHSIDTPTFDLQEIPSIHHVKNGNILSCANHRGMSPVCTEDKRYLILENIIHEQSRIRILRCTSQERYCASYVASNNIGIISITRSSYTVVLHVTTGVIDGGERSRYTIYYVNIISIFNCVDT